MIVFPELFLTVYQVISVKTSDNDPTREYNFSSFHNYI